MNTIELSPFGLLLFVGIAAALFGLWRLVRWLVRRSGMELAKRQRIMRMLPVAEILLWLVYVLSAISLVFDIRDQSVGPWFMAAVVLAVVIVSWFAVRDFVVGLALRAGSILEAGDRVRLDDGIEGRVVRLGLRVVSLDAPTGEEVLIPYSRLSRQAVTRSPDLRGAHRHRFDLTLGRPLDVPAAQSLIHRTALNHHWHSLVYEPEVALGEGGSYDVTVFALTPEHGPEIEAALRRDLG